MFVRLYAAGLPRQGYRPESLTQDPCHSAFQIRALVRPQVRNYPGPDGYPAIRLMDSDTPDEYPTGFREL